jgi:hypothetical protein
VSEWALQVPCRDKAEPINMLTVREVTRELGDPDERRVAACLLEVLSDQPQVTSFGDALSLLGRASVGTRRQLLDQARDKAELPSTGEVDDAKELAQLRHDDPHPPRPAGPLRDAQGFARMGCTEPNCNAVPVDETGRPRAVRAVRWWCPEHRHLAADGDMEDWTGPSLTFGPNGLERALSEDERDYYEQLDREREEEDEERRQRRDAEAEAKQIAWEKWRRDHGDEGVAVAGVPPSWVQQ